MFIGPPEYLTVSSSGPAGKVQYYSMGVFRLTEEKHNNKSVWYRHSEIMAMFYDNGKGNIYDHDFTDNCKTQEGAG